MCMGDFNEILLSHEKQGGLPKSQTCTDRFREVLEECGLVDLGFSGDMFTWMNNSHTRDRYIRERLDRAIADLEWSTHFLGYYVKNGDPHHSDHRTVIVTMGEGEEITQNFD